MMMGGAGMLVIPLLLLAFALSLMVPGVAWKVVGGMLMTLALLALFLFPAGRVKRPVERVPMAPPPAKAMPD